MSFVFPFLMLISNQITIRVMLSEESVNAGQQRTEKRMKPAIRESVSSLYLRLLRSLQPLAPSQALSFGIKLSGHRGGRQRGCSR